MTPQYDEMISNLKNTLGDVWDDVVMPAFDSEMSAYNWLSNNQECLDGRLPLVLLKGAPTQQQQVTAILERFDDITISPCGAFLR
jgi:uncharacterized protein (DUF2384 family)